jgi:hypothetical protein
MDRARDTQRLQEYERELVEAVLANDDREVNALRGIVAAFRAALRSDAPQATRPRARPRTAGTGLKGALKALLAERDMLSADEAVAVVAQMPQYSDRPPTRNTIISRLGDLVREGEAQSLRKGVYALVEPDQPDESPSNGAIRMEGFAIHSANPTESEP